MRSTRIQLLLMVLVFAAPVVLSYVWYFLVHPVNGQAYGTLLDVHPLPSGMLVDLDGQPASLDALHGKWLLVMEDGGACTEACEAKLRVMRQVRGALGHDDDRVERVMLIQDDQIPSARLRADNVGAYFLRAQGSPVAAAFTPEQGEPRQHVWVVDPNGNLVMRYPADPDLKLFLKDLQRLLKASQIG
jgi:cytochrome oxidase Cu insertion factor (SCO1/SenC/PrrC family)